MSMRLTRTLALVALHCGVLIAEPVAARVTSPGDLNAKRLEAMKRWGASARGPSTRDEARRSTDTGAPPWVQNISFSNSEASQFFVDGTTIPDVNFDIGPSWAGLLPISPAANESKKLFFWFFPPGPQGSSDDIILWLNGGPGCSSLYGLLKENGPFQWGTGDAYPTQNEQSWTNLSSVIYVDQPVGTGFSQGMPNAKNENDVAAQLVGFLQQFLEVFAELKGKKFYIAGESYAALFVSYTANFIFENTTRSTLDLDLQGVWINDGLLGWPVVQSQVPALDFVHKYENVFAFNQTFLGQLDSVAAACNYTDYMAKYVTYPPQGCDIWRMIANAALIINPAFNLYHILDTSVKWDVLGLPEWYLSVQTPPVYFDRADVKAVIHAPPNDTWEVCTFQGPSVFPNGDASLPPTFTVLPNVIEKSNRTAIVNGLADFTFIAAGTRIALQNMTWGGKQGFQKPIVNDSFIVDGVGAFGTMQSERGLAYFEVPLAGVHANRANTYRVSMYAPQASFQIMQYLLGLRESA
ncbi:Alpha/Beta hydrolase protein [Lactarius quietus]|nr:Alpha/Beta hydrolase protein [Lactarius quietus]